jgi:hypothetical protein
MDIVRYAILSYALYHCIIFLNHGMNEVDDGFPLVGMGWLGNV